MSNKNEYLYSIGIRLILTNTMKSKDVIETVKDYREIIDEAVGEGLSFEEIQAKIGTPKQVIAAIRNENKINRIPILSIVAVLSINLYVWSSRYLWWNIFPGIGEIVSIFTIYVCIVTWVALRGNSICSLSTLKETHIQKKKFTLINIIPIISPPICYALVYSALTSDYWLWKNPDNTGPIIVTIVTISILFNVLIMGYSIYVSIKQSPYYIAAFSHSCGAIGFLGMFRNLLSNMLDPEEMGIELLNCINPYMAGVILSILILILVRILDKKGSEICA